MAHFLKSLIIMTLLCWSAESSEASLKEEEEKKSPSFILFPPLQETEKGIIMANLNHFFEESDFLKLDRVKLNEKYYKWYVSNSYQERLIEKPELQDKVLLALNSMNTSMPQWPSKERDKVVGFSLVICGDTVYIEPFLGDNAL